MDQASKLGGPNARQTEVARWASINPNKSNESLCYNSNNTMKQRKEKAYATLFTISQNKAPINSFSI